MTYLQGLAEGIKLGIITREEAKVRLDAFLQKTHNTEPTPPEPRLPFVPQPTPDYYINPRRATRRKEDNVYWLF